MRPATSRPRARSIRVSHLSCAGTSLTSTEMTAGPVRRLQPASGCRYWMPLSIVVSNISTTVRSPVRSSSPEVGRRQSQQSRSSADPLTVAAASSPGRRPRSRCRLVVALAVRVGPGETGQGHQPGVAGVGHQAHGPARGGRDRSPGRATAVHHPQCLVDAVGQAQGPSGVRLPAVSSASSRCTSASWACRRLMKPADWSADRVRPASQGRSRPGGGTGLRWPGGRSPAARRGGRALAGVQLLGLGAVGRQAGHQLAPEPPRPRGARSGRRRPSRDSGVPGVGGVLQRVDEAGRLAAEVFEVIELRMPCTEPSDAHGHARPNYRCARATARARAARPRAAGAGRHPPRRASSAAAPTR